MTDQPPFVISDKQTPTRLRLQSRDGFVVRNTGKTNIYVGPDASLQQGLGTLMRPFSTLMNWTAPELWALLDQSASENGELTVSSAYNGMDDPVGVAEQLSDTGIPELRMATKLYQGRADVAGSYDVTTFNALIVNVRDAINRTLEVQVDQFLNGVFVKTTLLSSMPLRNALNSPTWAIPLIGDTVTITQHGTFNNLVTVYGSSAVYNTVTALMSCDDVHNETLSGPNLIGNQIIIAEWDSLFGNSLLCCNTDMELNVFTPQDVSWIWQFVKDGTTRTVRVVTTPGGATTLVRIPTIPYYGCYLLLQPSRNGIPADPDLVVNLFPAH